MSFVWICFKVPICARVCLVNVKVVLTLHLYKKYQLMMKKNLFMYYNLLVLKIRMHYIFSKNCCILSF